MIFRRKNQIDISLENVKDLPKDSEFSSLSDTNKTINKRKKADLKHFFVENSKNIKEDILHYFNTSKQYVQENKYFLWKNFLTFFSLFMIVFTYVMILWPFSYAVVGNYNSPISNFYLYSFNHLSLTVSGIVYILFLFIWIGLFVGHFFMYKKFEVNKYTKQDINSSKRNKAFYIIKFLSWGLLAAAVLLLFLMVIIPPTLYNSNDQLLVNKVISYVANHKVADLTIDEKTQFLNILNVTIPNNASEDTINSLVSINAYYPSNLSTIKLFFYSVDIGGVSSLSVAGIVFMSFASIFVGSSISLFIARAVNNYLLRSNFEKIKLDNISFNFEDVKENISSINNKIRGIYNTSQQKYQEYKNKDTFKKYKKRLIEEGKDTNPDKFTTDVEIVAKPVTKERKESLFGALRSIYKSKLKEHNLSEEYNSVERNRMKHKKPEIAVPDDELDELIDSLDIK